MGQEKMNDASAIGQEEENQHIKTIVHTPKPNLTKTPKETNG